MGWLKENCKGVVGAIVLSLSVFTGVVTFDGRYAKPSDVQAMEQKVVKSLSDFQKQQEVRENLRNLETLNRQITTQKQLIKQNPTDPELKEDLDLLKREREKAREKVQ